MVSAMVLFTPGAHALRKLNTNRPSRTEVATTVDAGHLQIETDIVNYARDKYSELTAQAIAVGGSNLRYGLTSSLEAQLTFFPWIHQWTHGPNGYQDTRNGLSDTVLALKQNVLGNDAGPVAAAVMGYVQLPTSQDRLGSNSVEGGLILPLAIELGPATTVAVMQKWGRTRKAAEPGYATLYDSTLMLAHSLNDKWSIYTEFWNEMSSDQGAAWQATWDAGLTYLVRDNLQVDIGMAYGLTAATDDFNVLTGFSLRL